MAEKSAVVLVVGTELFTEELRQFARHFDKPARRVKPAVVVQMPQRSGGHFRLKRLATVGPRFEMLRPKPHFPIRDRQPVGHCRPSDEVRSVEMVQGVSEIVHESRKLSR